MAWINNSDIDRFFTYHAPGPFDVANINEIRLMGKRLAETILRLTPKCADQSMSIRKVREAVMTANAAIVCRKEPSPPLEAMMERTANCASKQWECPHCGAVTMDAACDLRTVKGVIVCPRCTMPERYVE